MINSTASRMTAIGRAALPGLSIEEFERQVVAIIGRPTALRPFVCSGSPLTCRVFIVGLNPASPMKAGFWDFWRPGTGFDKGAWMDAYVAERATRPLKPGRTRRRRISPSRAVIEWVVGELGEIPCLETNIFATAAEEFADLDLAMRDTKTFDYLLAALKPDVIIVHGADAVAHVESKATTAVVLAVPHFSRGWSQENARALGRKVKEMIVG